MNNSPNHAHFDIDDNKSEYSQEVILRDKEVGILHVQSDPGSEFNISIQDRSGNVEYQEKGIKNESGRWGKRINLPFKDNYNIIKVTDTKGTKTIDVFAE